MRALTWRWLRLTPAARMLVVGVCMRDGRQERQLFMRLGVKITEQLEIVCLCWCLSLRSHTCLLSYDFYYRLGTKEKQ